MSASSKKLDPKKDLKGKESLSNPETKLDLDELACPIGFEEIKQCASLPCGHYFEDVNIKNYLRKINKLSPGASFDKKKQYSADCPCCNKKFSLHDIRMFYPFDAIKNKVLKYARENLILKTELTQLKKDLQHQQEETQRLQGDLQKAQQEIVKLKTEVAQQSVNLLLSVQVPTKVATLNSVNQSQLGVGPKPISDDKALGQSILDPNKGQLPSSRGTSLFHSKPKKNKTENQRSFRLCGIC